MYGRFTEEMKDAVRPYVEGQHVLDVGAGNCAKAKTLARLGAEKVICVDPEFPVEFYIDPELEPYIFPMYGYLDEKIAKHGCAALGNVAFLSWIPNKPLPGLVEVLQGMEYVIYLGCNYGGTACGTLSLYLDLLGRELLVEIATPQNTLLILGRRKYGYTRNPTFEEYCGVNTREMYHWEDKARIEAHIMFPPP